ARQAGSPLLNLAGVHGFSPALRAAAPGLDNLLRKTAQKREPLDGVVVLYQPADRAVGQYGKFHRIPPYSPHEMTEDSCVSGLSAAFNSSTRSCTASFKSSQNSSATSLVVCHI